MVGRLANRSMYCGVIIALLFLTSCYWHTPSEPVQWALSVPYADTRIGFGMTRVLQWLGKVSAPTAALAPDAPLPDSAPCAWCWTDLALSKGRSLFGLIPRPPSCVSGTTCAAVATDTPSSSHWFLGVPGTKLGFALDWSVFLPQK